MTSLLFYLALVIEIASSLIRQLADDLLAMTKIGFRS